MVLSYGGHSGISERVFMRIPVIGKICPKSLAIGVAAGAAGAQLWEPLRSIGSQIAGFIGGMTGATTKGDK
jgi:hypothetical protein